MSHEKSDLVIFDEQGQIEKVVKTETAAPPAPNSRFTKDPNATVLDESYEIDESGNMRTVFLRMIKPSAATFVVIIFLFVVVLVGLKSSKDHERRMSDFQAQIESRTARGCRYVYPGVSPDGGVDPDIGCRPAPRSQSP